MADYADNLRKLAEPSMRGDRVKVAIERAARLSGLSYWRTFDLWYRKARRVEDFEVAAISKALRRKARLEALNELSELRLRIEALEARYAKCDQDFHGPDIDGLGQILGRGRKLACASG